MMPLILIVLININRQNTHLGFGEHNILWRKGASRIARQDSSRLAPLGANKLDYCRPLGPRLGAPHQLRVGHNTHFVDSRDGREALARLDEGYNLGLANAAALLENELLVACGGGGWGHHLREGEGRGVAKKKKKQFFFGKKNMYFWKKKHVFFNCITKEELRLDRQKNFTPALKTLYDRKNFLWAPRPWVGRR